MPEAKFGSFFSALEGANAGTVETASPFSDIFAVAKRREQGRSAVAAMAGAQTDPARGANVRVVADQSGLPAPVVDRNFERVQQDVRTNETRSILDRNPALAQWYAAGNYDFVSGDELRRYDGVGWMLRSFGQSFGQGTREVELANIRFAQITGAATPADVARADQLSAGRQTRDYGAHGWIEKSWTGLAGQLPMIGASMAQGFIRGTQGMAVGAATGAGVAGIGAAAGATGGFAAGSLYGNFEGAFRLEAGMAYDEFLGFRDENGQPLEDNVAKAAAIAAGLANGVMEVYGLRETVGRIPGVDKLFGRLTRGAIAEALKRPTVRAALSAFAARTFKAGGIEIGTEAAQEAVTILAGEIAKGASDGEFARTTPEAAAARIADTIEQTAQMMTLLGPLVGGSRLAGDVAAARRAERTRSIFSALQENAEGSELREKLPGHVRDAVKAATAGGPVETVYVPVEKMTELFQKEGIAPTVFDGKIAGWRETYAEALTTGGDVAIPIGDFYANIAGTDFGAQLADHMKFRPEDMTATEAKDFNEAWDAAREKLFAEAETEGKAEAASQKAADPVFEDVKEKAIAAGIAPDQAAQYGTLYRAFFQTLAARSGRTPEELYRAYGLEIRQAVDEPGRFRRVTGSDLTIEALRKGEDEKARKAVAKRMGNSLLDFIVARGGVVDSGGELRGMDAKGYKRGKLLRKPTEDKGAALPGMGGEAVRGADNEWGLDATALAAWEAGYFPEFTERPSPNDLIQAIHASLAGEDRFSTTFEETATPEEQTLIQARRLVEELGIDMDASNEEIKEAMLAATNDAEEAGELFQAVWHGSPHVFDEFSLHKIGTGEGEQSFGWGLYFTGHREIAEYYREKLAGEKKKVRLEIDGTDDFDTYYRRDVGTDEAAWDDAAIQREAVLQLHARLTIYQGVKSAEQAATIIEREKGYLRNTIKNYEAAHAGGRVFDKYSSSIETDKFALSGVKRALEMIEAGRVKLLPPDAPGRLYKVDIPEDSEFLDWEKPLNQQSDMVRAAVKAALSPDENAIEYWTGRLQQAFDEDGPMGYTQDRFDRAVAEAFESNGYGEEFGGEIWTELHEAAPGDVVAEFRAFLDAHGASIAPSDTGQSAYQLLTATHNSAEGASRKLAAAGVAGIKYPAGSLSGAASDAQNYVVFDDKLIKILEFEQADEKGKRGSIQFGQGRTVVSMFQSADLSTFLHESGHFFLEVMRDVSSAADAAPDLAADWEALKKYLGTEDGNLTVDAHEKFARSFEAYLFEGRAPSEALAGIFSRFSAWLRMLYREVKRLGVKVPKEIAGVMDRMLASDREIDTLVRQSDFKPMFADANAAGMTDKQFAAYRETADRAVEHAKRDLTTKMLAEVKRETTRGYRDARAKIKAAVAEELSRVSIFQAQHYLKTGEFLRSGLKHDAVKRLKLDRGALVEMFGKEVLSRLPRSRPPIYVLKGGVHPDYIAEMFGIDSGHELIELLMSVEPYARAVATETTKRLREQFGDLLVEQDRRVQEAKASIDNDERGKLLEAEYKVIIKKGGLDSSINRDRARIAAALMIGGKQVRDATRVNVYATAEVKAARSAERDILAGDWIGAAAWKQKQIFNHYLAREARQAAADADKILTSLSRFAGKKRPDGINPGHVLQIEAILERFDLRRATTGKAIERRESLVQFARDQEALGNVVSIPDEILNEAVRKSYKQMTVEELRALFDAVRNLEHLGRRWDKVRDQQKLREFGAVRDELTAGIRKTKERKRSKNRNPTKLERFKDTTLGMDAALLKMEQVIEWIDQGDINGPARRFIWQPIADAEAAENAMQLEYTGRIAQIIEKFKPGYLTERITVNAVNTTFKRADIFAAALNTGNESNLDKLLRGEGWSEMQLRAVLSHLTNEDWDAVVAIRGVVNSLWPKIAAVQKRVTGFEPEKITPSDYVTDTGRVIPGGYYPVVYDPRAPGAHDVADRTAAQADKLFENTYIRPDTPHGFTNKRVQQYTRPFKLDLMVLPQHLSQVIHDITHREAIRDVYKLIADPVVRAEIEARMNSQIYGMMRPWLKAIANDREPNDGMNAVNRFAEKGRTNATAMAMGYRFTTILSQYAGFFSAMERVKVTSMASAIAQFARHPVDTTQFVWSKSAEMKHRRNQLDRDIRDGLRALDGKQGVFNPTGTWAGWSFGLVKELATGRIAGMTNDAKRYAFYAIGFTDLQVTIPTWTAAYNEHLRAYPTDDAGAVAAADRTVRLTQAAGGIKDQSRIQRERGLWRYLTMFYSYFNSLYNRLRTIGRDTRTAIVNRDLGAFPGLLARSFFVVVGPAIFGELLAGRAPFGGDDDDEGWLRWMARKVLIYPLLSIPGIREAASTLDSGYGYTFTPAARGVEAVIKTIRDVRGMTEGKDVSLRLATKHAMMTAGYFMGLPIGQPITTVDNLWLAMEEGDDVKLRDFFYSRKP